MVDRSTLFGIVQIGALLHRDKADVSRSAARGDFGKAIVAKGSKTKRYTLAGIERSAGRKFSSAEIKLAQSTHDNQSIVRSDVLREFVKMLLALRDRQHLDHVHAQGFTFYVPLPPFNLSQPQGSDNDKLE